MRGSWGRVGRGEPTATAEAISYIDDFITAELRQRVALSTRAAESAGSADRAQQALSPGCAPAAATGAVDPRPELRYTSRLDQFPVSAPDPTRLASAWTS